MKILHLTLKKKWFDMILSGEKTEEYRATKSHWQRRLCDFAWRVFCIHDCVLCVKDGGKTQALYGTLFKDFDAIEFRNGYSKTAPTVLVECEDITIGIGRQEWGAPAEPVFIIKCGKVLETKNCERL